MSRIKRLLGGAAVAALSTGCAVVPSANGPTTDKPQAPATPSFFFANEYIPEGGLSLDKVKTYYRPAFQRGDSFCEIQDGYVHERMLYGGHYGNRGAVVPAFNGYVKCTFPTTEPQITALSNEFAAAKMGLGNIRMDQRFLTAYFELPNRITGPLATLVGKPAPSATFMAVTSPDKCDVGAVTDPRNGQLVGQSLCYFADANLLMVKRNIPGGPK